MESAKIALPLANDARLCLANPSLRERERIWHSTHPEWGTALPSQDAYVQRESQHVHWPLARDGGIAYWILTNQGSTPDSRPIFSSCETLCKAAVSARRAVRGTEGEIKFQTGLAWAIGSVYTEKQYRKKGYAGRMLRELGPRLRTWHPDSMATRYTRHEPDMPVLFSVLYSDIGKEFYARHGWNAMPSKHVSFSPLLPGDQTSQPITSSAHPIQALGCHDLGPLCARDQDAICEAVRERAREIDGPVVALLPNCDTMLWHLFREDYMTSHIFGRVRPERATPVWRGAICELPGHDRRRVWAVWARGYYGGLDFPDMNTLYILRLGLDFPPRGEFDCNHDQVEAAVSAAAAAVERIVERARREAAEWKCGEVQLWNPTPETMRLLERGGVLFREVTRKMDAIPSLMYYGNGRAGGAGESAAVSLYGAAAGNANGAAHRDDDDGGVVEWVANERYGWF